MPLKRGSSQETISANIKRLVHEYDEDGKIGTSHPKSRKKAIKQAAAIAYDKAGRSRDQTKSSSNGKSNRSH
jgi:hypothetical protein